MSKTIVLLCLLLIGLAPSVVELSVIKKLLSILSDDGDKEEKQKKDEFVNSTICLGPLGCFSNDAPFYDPPRRPFSKLPFDRKRLDVKFRLFTRKNPNDYQLISDDKDTILQSNFDPNHQTYFFIHGFLDSTVLGRWLTDVVKLSLKRQECNAIIVDWARANKFPYYQAVANTRAVGAETAHLINTLQAVRNADPQKVHVIGHSLGAQTAGYVGERVKNLGRITGLDPAAPYYTDTHPTTRLDPTDANFVDVIHSDASVNLLSGLGTVNSVGHVDFFPNNGNDQPGCEDPIISLGTLEKLLTQGLVEGIRKSAACDHDRAVTLFMASILPENDCLMVAQACTSWKDFLSGKCGDCEDDPSRCAVMGLDTFRFYKGNPKRRKYYLLTSAKHPFCLHQYHVSLVLANNTDASTVHGEADIVIQGSNSKLEAKLSKSRDAFEAGSTLTYLVTSDKAVGQFDRVDFRWKKTHDKSRSNRYFLGFTMGHGDHESESTDGNLYVRLVRISPLVVTAIGAVKQAPPTLCGKGVTSVSSGETVTFHLNTNC